MAKTRDSPDRRYRDLDQHTSTYHIESTKQMNMYGNRSISSLDARSFYCHKLSWFGPVYCHDMLPYVILQGTVDGSRHRGRLCKSWKDNFKECTGQSRMTEVDGQSSQQMYLTEYPNDACASWVLVNWSVTMVEWSKAPASFLCVCSHDSLIFNPATADIGRPHSSSTLPAVFRSIQPATRVVAANE